MKRIPDLLAEAKALELKAKALREEAANVAADCPHKWDHPDGKYDPIHEPGQYFAGDPVGTMGIDRQLPFHSASQTIKRWTRVCKECGHIQHTRTTKNVPDGSLSKEVPDFTRSRFQVDADTP